MRPTTTRRRRMVLAAASVTALSLLVTACGSDDSDDTGAADPNKKVTLKVQTFGSFGYEKLFEQYQKEHPNITIQASAEGDLGKYTNALTQRIAAGSGAGDVVAIEEGAIINFLQAPDKFVNLQEKGINNNDKDWLDWKWQQATTADGKTTIGAGTDVGGLAMCYRTDLFKKAGLPTDRDEVSALWPTWQDYLKAGQDFMKKAPSGTAFMDSATNTYNSILMQEAGKTTGQTYFDQNNQLVIESNPAVKNAWDITNTLIDAGLSKKLKSFTPEWNAGFKSCAFATIACPAWMGGYIKDQAGDAGKGKWDIATVPGGGGSWGGSWLAAPTQGKHQAEAVELIKFLSSPAGQLEAFKAKSNLPSSPKDHADPALLEFKDPYFNNVPFAKVFIEGAVNLKPVYLGAKNQAVRDSLENDLRSVESGKRTSAQGWESAIKGAKAAAGV